MLQRLDNFFENKKGARRITLFWCLGLITYAVIKVIQPEVITTIQSSGASVVLGVFGILTTVIGFYTYSRHKEGKSPERDNINGN